MMPIRCGLAFIPVSLVVIATLLLSIAFPLAVVNRDVAPFFPYLSFLGSKPPASILFSYLLYVSALLVVAGSYVRYRLVWLSTSHFSKHFRRLNIAGFVLSIVAGVGMSVVAAVRITEVYTIHMLGAGLFFWPSAAYCVLQTVLSYLMLTPQVANGTVCRMRLALSLMSSVSILTCVVSSIFAALGWSRVRHHVSDKQHWQESDGGYLSHLVSAFSEWTMVLSFLFYFLTFIPEFRRVRLRVIFISHDGQRDDSCIMGNGREGLQNDGRSYHLLSTEGSEEELIEMNNTV